jgi:hypothetical protein
MKICPVVPQLFCADGQTDRHDEANSRFSQFSENAEKFVQTLIYLEFV